jgi:uncharacterized membrane protein YeaQ/YmgE (transglycosylase-associated protein family)
MGLLITLIVGGIIGWLAARVLGRNEGVIASIIIGIIGAFIGGWIASIIGSAPASMLGFSLSGLIWSFIGALILVAILNAFQHRSSHV